MKNRNWLIGVFTILFLCLITIFAYAQEIIAIVSSEPLWRNNGNRYLGNGSVQNIEGTRYYGERLGPSIGNIGFISPDGRLTINLPAFIDNNKLDPNDVYELYTEPNIGIICSINKYEGTGGAIVYANTDLMWLGRVPLKRGWNLTCCDTPIRAGGNIIGHNWGLRGWWPE